MTTDPLATVRLDFSKEVGKIKPMHAVGQPPIQGWDNFTLFHYLKEAHIPYSRLHDTGGPFGKNLYVDIPNIFRDFDADVDDPASYDFAFTDLLLADMVKNGVEPFYRLGVTIENRACVRKYRIFPPKDFDKWARICEHVVAHYNEGWADGFHHGITYWEIWNEPDLDNDEDPENSPMWCGTFDEYCRLYEVASKRLKARFPSIKVGGFASCGFYGAEPGVPLRVRADNPDTPAGRRNAYRVECALKFLDFVRDTTSPLDFFSFHSYAEPKEMMEQIGTIALELERRGLNGVELILNEWMPGRSLKRTFTPELAADIATVIVRGQHTRLDMLMIYDARIAARNIYAPLFHPMTARPTSAYWALFCFGELYRRGAEVFSIVEGDCESLSIAAATDGADGALMLVNNGDEARALAFETNGARFRYGAATDADRQHELLTVCPDTIPPHAFMLLVFDHAVRGVTA